MFQNIISFTSSSSCCAASTDLPDPLPQPVSIVYRYRAVFGTELLYIGSSWSLNFSQTTSSSKMISVFLRHSVHLKWYQLFSNTQNFTHIKPERKTKKKSILKIQLIMWVRLRISWLYSCTSIRRTHPVLGILGLTLNSIRWWGFSSVFTEFEECLFIAITPKSTLTWSGSTCYGPLYGPNKSI